MGAFEDLTGRVFGRWTVVSQGERRGHIIMWLCRCECGTEKLRSTSTIRSGATRSCGCLRREASAIRSKTHGQSSSPEFVAWAAMLQRCLYRRGISFANYGGRGIRVCDRWAHSFENFFADVGPRPSKDHSLDRIDVHGHYEPGNVRWATRVVQARNRRDNRYVTAGSVTMIVTDWSVVNSIPIPLILARIDRLGWDPARAVTEPVGTTRRGPKKRPTTSVIP